MQLFVDITKLLVINFSIEYLQSSYGFRYGNKRDIRIRRIIYNMGAITLIYILSALVA